MTDHVFHEIYLHINWHTKDDVPSLTPYLEKQVYQLIRQRCIDTPGVYLHGMGGTETHMHVVINIEPQVQASDFIGKVKGGSSHDINALEGAKMLEWQRGFGVVSFAKNQLDRVLDYVHHQKEHHANGTTWEKLEATEQEL